MDRRRRDPRRAARQARPRPRHRLPRSQGGRRRYASARAGGAVFRLSGPHGAWRVAYRDGRTVDFTPLADGIEEDLADRDFTINAIARPLAGGDELDPFSGQRDIDQASSARFAIASSATIHSASCGPSGSKTSSDSASSPARKSSSAATPRSSPGPPVSGSSASSRSFRRSAYPRLAELGLLEAARRLARPARPRRRRVYTCLLLSASSAIRSSDCPFRTSSGDTLAAC